MALSNNDQQHFENILSKRKDELEEMLHRNDHFGNETEFAQESTGELSNYDNHPADLGTELYEREKDIALNDLHEKELNDIHYALRKMEDGQYGICEECGKEIPKERLEAIPSTTFCVEHSKGQHVSENRPVEEQVTGPAFSKFTNDKRDAAFFDAEDSWQGVSRYGTSETPSDFTGNKKTDYNDMNEDSDDEEGYVEDVEGFAASDIYGNNTGTIPNKKHDEYEDKLDYIDDLSRGDNK